jgi:hypothetical protein
MKDPIMTNQPTPSELENDLKRAVDKSMSLRDVSTQPPDKVLIAQVLGIAESIKSLQRDIDDMAAEFSRRIDDIRKRIGSNAR